MVKALRLVFKRASFLGVLEALESIAADFFSHRLDQMIDLRHRVQSSLDLDGAGSGITTQVIEVMEIKNSAGVFVAPLIGYTINKLLTDGVLLA
jgi:hypothetical protein